MKYIKIAAIVVFILALGLYCAGFVREKQEEDPTIPVMTSDRDTLEVSVHYETEDLLEGLKASDEKDGDLTDHILVGEFSQFIEKGLCNLSYVVFDSSNQAATLTRRVRFTDYESPKLTLKSPLVFTEGRISNALSGIGARDLLDGDISSLVKQTDSTVNYQTAGDYTVSVEVTNSFGDVESQTLPVHIILPVQQALEITLTENIVYLHAGDSFLPGNYVDGLEDSYGNALDISLVTWDSQVDAQKPGCYEVHYTAENENGLKGETWMTVIVRE